MAAANLTAQRLRELLDYDQETGAFTWRVRTSDKIKIGKPAGCVTPTGYILIGVDGGHYLAHRLAWLHVTGDWPALSIDHINNVKDDNRFANLRDVTPAMNMHNQRAKRSNNTSGYTGVQWHARARKFAAHITIKGKLMHIGLFDSAEAAHAAYLAKKREHHPGYML